MKFVPKELEANVVAAVSAALAAAGIDADTCEVVGTWQSAAHGYVRWIETGLTPAVVCVTVATALPQTYTSPSVQFAANIELFVRPDKDPQGELLVSIAQTLENMLRTWQAETYQQAFDLLDVADEFAVGSVSGNQGTAPTVQNERCSVSWPITISGSYIRSEL